MSDPQFEMARSEAQELLAQGRLDEALGLYRKLHEEAPSNNDVLLGLIEAADKKGDLSNRAFARYNLANNLLAAGQLDDALQVYEQIELLFAESAPQKPGPFSRAGSLRDKSKNIAATYRPRVSMAKGQILLARGDADAAITCLADALSSEAGNKEPQLHYLLGVAYMEKEMYKEASGSFQEVVRLSPNDAADAYERLGDVFVRQGKSPKATVWYEKAADQFIKQERWQSAIHALESTMEIEPNNKETIARLADLYHREHMADNALAEYRKLAALYREEGLLDKELILYERLTELNPADTVTWAALTDIYRGILQRDPSNFSVRLKLIRYLEVYGDADALSSEYVTLAQSYRDKGFRDEALAALTRAIEATPESATLREQMADYLEQFGHTEAAFEHRMTLLSMLLEGEDPQRAADYGRDLLERYPDSDELKFKVSSSLQSQGDHDAALDSLESILDQNPEHEGALLQAADALSSLGRHEEAREKLTKVLEISPGSTDVRQQLVDKLFEAGDLEGVKAHLLAQAPTLLAEGQFDVLEGLYQRVLMFEPEDVTVRQGLCATLRARGDGARLERELILVLSLHEHAGDLAQAASVCEQIVQCNGENLNAIRRLGRIRLQQGRTVEGVMVLSDLASRYLAELLHPQAIALFLESLEADPGNMDLRARLVDVYTSQLQVAEAIKHQLVLVGLHLAAQDVVAAQGRSRQIIDLQPGNLDSRVELAILFLQAGFADEGGALLEEALSTFLAKGQVTRAVEVFDKLAEAYRQQSKDELFWATRIRRAECLGEHGMVDEALAAYHQLFHEALLADVSTRTQTVANALIELCVDKGRTQDGVAALRSCQAVEGLSSEATNLVQETMMVLFERSGLRGEALKMLVSSAQEAEARGDRALALAVLPRLARLMVEEGAGEQARDVQWRQVRLHLETQDLGSAKTVLQTLLESSKDPGADRRRFADQLFETELYEAALVVNLDILEAEPDNAEIRGRVAYLYARSLQVTKAAAILLPRHELGSLQRVMTALRDAGPSQAGPRALLLGDFYHAMGFYEDALREYDHALRGGEALLLTCGKTADAFLRLGETEMAQRLLVGLLEQPGFDEDELLDTRYFLADLYLGTGRYLEALEMYHEITAVKLHFKDVSKRVETLETALAAQKRGEDVAPHLMALELKAYPRPGAVPVELHLGQPPVRRGSIAQVASSSVAVLAPDEEPVSPEDVHLGGETPAEPLAPRVEVLAAPAVASSTELLQQLHQAQSDEAAHVAEASLGVDVHVAPAPAVEHPSGDSEAPTAQPQGEATATQSVPETEPVVFEGAADPTGTEELFFEGPPPA